jgi:hypothetical protein
MSAGGAVARELGATGVATGASRAAMLSCSGGYAARARISAS